MKKIVKTVCAFMLLFILLTPFQEVSAEEYVGFSVKAQLPKNQINQENSYFNLRVEPGQKQAIETIIYNHGAEEITVKVSVHNASTGSNGLVMYEEQEEVDDSLEVPLTDIASLEKEEWVIPAGESVAVTTNLTLPNEPFDGIKLGGLHFEKVLEADESDDGVNIQNNYAYIVGLQLSQTDKQIEPDLNLNFVEPRLVNYRTAVVANIQNTQPTLLEDAEITAKVFEENETDPIKELYQEQVNIAPNSNMDVVINWENEPLEEGDYRLQLQVKGESKTWDWEESFEIDEKAKVLNEEAVELETEDSNKALYIAGIVMLVLIVIVLIWYIRRLKKKI